MNLGEINALLTDSQHHNLLGNQISPKSEDFCIWWSFCTLVTMATAAILNYGGYSYKSLMKGIQFFFKSPLFCFHGNCSKVCPTDSDFFGLSRPTRCGRCSYQVSSISVWQVTCYDHFCVFQFFSILAISMASYNTTWIHAWCPYLSFYIRAL